MVLLLNLLNNKLISLMKQLLTILFTLTLVFGCSSNDELTKESVSRILLSPIKKSVYIGDTIGLKATHFPSYLEAPDLYWETSDFNKGVISESGLFTAKDTGVVYLSVYIPKTTISDSIKVNILKRAIVPPNNGGGSGNGSNGGSNSSTTSRQCAAKTKKGKRCKRTADKGSSYCWQHRK